MKVLTQKSIKITFLVVFAYKLVCVDDGFSKLVVILKVHHHCKEVMKKHFNKNLIMSEKE